MLELQENILFFYLIIPLLLIVLRKHKKVNLWFYIIGVLIIISIGFRGEMIGSDTEVYKGSFESLTFFDTKEYEITWIGICSLAYYLNQDFRFIQLFYALITIIPIFHVIKKESRLPFISVLLFIIGGLYFQSLNIIRQMAAIALGVVAIYNYINDKYFLSLIFCFIAFAFHKTALFLPVTIILYHIFKEYIDDHALFLLLSSLIIGLFIYPLFASLSSSISIEKYQGYGDYANEKNASIIKLFITNCISTAFNIKFYIEYKKNTNDNKYIGLFIVSQMLLNCLLYSIGMNRLCYYVSILGTIAIPNIYSKKSGDFYFNAYIIYYLVSYSLAITNSSSIFPF